MGIKVGKPMRKVRDVSTSRLRRAFRLDTEIEMLRRDEHPVGVLESAHIDAIDPDGEGFAECRARVSGRADEIRDDRAAGFNNPIAHPAHAARVFDPVFMAKAEIAREIGAHGVGIEHHRIE